MLRRFVVPLLSVTLALAACVEQPTAPPAPEAAPSADLLTGSLDLTGVVEFVSLPNLSSQRSAAKYIRAAEGGSVSLHGFRIDIPAGALPQDTLVTIDLPRDGVLAKRVLAEFGPHGIQFNTPVTISFPLTGTLPAGGGIGVARWENDGWTSLGGWIHDGGATLSATTPHFSTYSARKDVFAGG